jgi:hypothetical protein
MLLFFSLFITLSFHRIFGFSFNSNYIFYIIFILTTDEITDKIFKKYLNLKTNPLMSFDQRVFY